MERDILKKVVTSCLLSAQALSAPSVRIRYQFIQDGTEPWPVQVRCRLLAVSTAG